MTGATNLGCYSILSKSQISTTENIELEEDESAQVSQTLPSDKNPAIWNELDDIWATASATPGETATRQSFTYGSGQISDFVSMTFVPIVTLVHQPTDLQSNEPSSSSSTGSSISSSATTASSKSNAAVRMGASLSGWEDIGSSLGVSLAGAVLGAAVILTGAH